MQYLTGVCGNATSVVQHRRRTIESSCELSPQVMK
jgi:hypothetical protein